MSTFYELSAVDITGKERSMSEFKGKVVVVVNTASKCGFTPQYKGLQALYEEYKEAGLVILGFPCNQFGKQEPGTEAEIADFCEASFGVSFPMFAKINVNGKDAHPIYQFLKNESPGVLGIELIKWNFTKFVLDREGNVVQRFAPKDKPEALAKTIQELL